MLQQNAVESVKGCSLLEFSSSFVTPSASWTRRITSWLSEDFFDCIQFFKSDFICEISTKWYTIFHYILTAVGLQRKVYMM